MHNTTFPFILTLILLIFNPGGCALASDLIDTKSDVKNYLKVISESDCLHISKQITFVHGTGYQTKWTYSITPYTENRSQVIKTVITGLNQSSYKKQVITLIPFKSLSDIKNPESQIASVTVNGKIKKHLLLSPGDNLDKILINVKKRFGTKDFLSAKVNSRVSMLLIDAGIVKPNESVRIEYEEKVIGGAIVPHPVGDSYKFKR